MKKYKFFFYALLLPLLAAQCDKPIFNFDPPNDNDGLPPITTEGKNTFGCRVNGEVWLPKNTAALLDPIMTVSYHAPTGGINISARRRIDELKILQSIAFGSTNVKDIGEHVYRNARYYNYDTSFCTNSTFDIDTILHNKLEILKLDTENRIISGTFEFTAVNDECEDVVITDGRFDLDY